MSLKSLSGCGLCLCTCPRKPKEAHIATWCHFFAAGQLYGFSGSSSQSDAAGPEARAFSSGLPTPFSILSAATSLSVANPDIVLSSSENTGSPNSPSSTFSGSCSLAVLCILGYRGYRRREIGKEAKKNKEIGTRLSGITVLQLELWVCKIPCRTGTWISDIYPQQNTWATILIL